MDLAKLKNDQKLDLCKWYFRVGFLCLPFVWLVNAFWFFDEAFKKPLFEEQKKIKIYVVLSAIGAAIWAVGLSVWVYIFQTHRAEWGEFGDYLSFVIPTGFLIPLLFLRYHGNPRKEATVVIMQDLVSKEN